jgi:hypothetical protein
MVQINITIPDSIKPENVKDDILFEGTYRVFIRDASLEQSKANKDDMLVPVFEVLEPAEFQGKRLRTWMLLNGQYSNQGLSRLYSLLLAIGKPNPRTIKNTEELIRRRLFLVMGNPLEKTFPDPKDPGFERTILQNNIKRFESDGSGYDSPYVDGEYDYLKEEVMEVEETVAEDPVSEPEEENVVLVTPKPTPGPQIITRPHPPVGPPPVKPGVIRTNGPAPGIKPSGGGNGSNTLNRKPVPRVTREIDKVPF